MGLGRDFLNDPEPDLNVQGNCKKQEGTRMEVNKKFIVNLQGKDFILYDGLLDMAHQMGLLSITTEMVQYDGKVVIFKATAKTADKSFDGYGDATGENVNKMIAKHMIRMAETRAKARALRDLTNVGMCSVEELGGDDEPAKKSSYDTAKEVFAPKIRKDQTDELKRLADELNLTATDMKDKIKSEYKVNGSQSLTIEQADDLIAALQAELIN